jgi:hypothetical protein
MAGMYDCEQQQFAKSRDYLASHWKGFDRYKRTYTISLLLRYTLTPLTPPY